VDTLAAAIVDYQSQDYLQAGWEGSRSSGFQNVGPSNLMTKRNTKITSLSQSVQNHTLLCCKKYYFKKQTPGSTPATNPMGQKAKEWSKT
jgi:hypothetical protein